MSRILEGEDKTYTSNWVIATIAHSKMEVGSCYSGFYY
jgi:hypothetical protein